MCLSHGMNTKSIINNIIDKQSLELFSVGCDEKNFEILSNIVHNHRVSMNDITKKCYPLTKMPLNRRINMLVKAGLIERVDRKTGLIPTALGKKLLLFIEEIRTYLRKEAQPMIEKYATT